MKVCVRTSIISVIIVCALSAYGVESKAMDRLFVVGNELRQKTTTVLMRAVETPGIAHVAGTPESPQILARLAESGANAVCFDLWGFSPDGQTLAPEVPKTIDTLMEEVIWRRMFAICRVFAPDAPADPAYRKKAIQAAAAALKSENRVVYWIDGPNNGELAKVFLEAAPGLVVAAEQSGAIDVVKQWPAKPAGKPVLLVGTTLTVDALETAHCVLPDNKETLAVLDKALANPAESKPWTPDNSVLTEQERAEGFVSLFDGKSLDGWYIIGKNKDGFAANDGVIEWKSIGGGGLYTRERYDNFVLRLEWKINKNGNSGIYLRAPRAGRQSKIGMEFQLMGDADTPITNQTTGAIYDVVAPKINASKPAGEWNAVEITLNGASMKGVLNGQTVQDINLDENPELKHRLRRGFIGLQDHACQVNFRNIRIKKL